jgi:hypothetical protein
VREVSGRLAPVIEREARAIAAGTEAVHAPFDGVAPAPGPARQARRRRDAIGAWLRDMARLAIAELRQHPSTWPHSEALDAEPRVVSTRRGIQRYARDVALNVAAIFLLLALFVALL